MFVLAQAITSVVSVTALIVAATCLHTILYHAAVTLVLPVLFKLPLLHRVLRPFLGHYLRHAWSFRSIVSWGLLIRACSLGSWLTLSWELAESIFDYAVAEVCSYHGHYLGGSADSLVAHPRVTHRRGPRSDHRLGVRLGRRLLQALRV